MKNLSFQKPRIQFLFRKKERKAHIDMMKNKCSMRRISLLRCSEGLIKKRLEKSWKIKPWNITPNRITGERTYRIEKVRKRTRWMKCEGRQKSNLKQDIMFQSYPVHTENFQFIFHQSWGKEGAAARPTEKTEGYYMNIIKTRKRNTRQNLLSKKLWKIPSEEQEGAWLAQTKHKKKTEEKKSLSDSCQ